MAGNLHTEEISSLFCSKEYLFPIWFMQLIQGFNLFLYGYGSKRVLLRKFCESPVILDTYRVFFIDGVNPSLRLEGIVTKLYHEYVADFEGSIGVLKKLSSQEERSKYVHSTLCLLIRQSLDNTRTFIDEKPKPILFAIANIDGNDSTSPIRMGEIRNFIFSLLLSVPQYKLICTSDHINGTFLINPSLISGFRTIFYDVSTFLSYTEEVKSCNFSIYKGKNFLSSAQKNHLIPLTVLNNLSVNARKIYGLFIHVQYKWICLNESIMLDKGSSKTKAVTAKPTSFTLANLENSPSVNQLALKLTSSPVQTGPKSLSKSVDYSHFPGISFSILFNLSVENFLTSSESSFKTIIQEFLDHNILSCKKSAEGEELYFIPFQNYTLAQISSNLNLSQ